MGSTLVKDSHVEQLPRAFGRYAAWRLPAATEGLAAPLQ